MRKRDAGASAGVTLDTFTFFLMRRTALPVRPPHASSLCLPVLLQAHVLPSSHTPEREEMDGGKGAAPDVWAGRTG